MCECEVIVPVDRLNMPLSFFRYIADLNSPLESHPALWVTDMINLSGLYDN